MTTVNDTINLEAGVISKSASVSVKGNSYKESTIIKEYPVTGMTCASCSGSVQSMLENTAGVVKVSVNFANAIARIEYKPTETTPEVLKATIQSIGYDLVIDESEEAKEALEQKHQQHFHSLKYKTIGAVALSVPLMFISMVFMDIPYANYIMWALATPVLVLGARFFTGAWKQLKHRSANMDTLVALSTGVAYLFSVFNTLFPAYWHTRGLHAHVYFEAAAVVIAFILTGKLLEEKAKGNTAAAIKKLIGLQPSTVTIVHSDGRQEEIAVKQLQPGAVVLVKPGEKIAVDGEVVQGKSFVDESMITGEPVAVEKLPGSNVFAGTINQKGSFSFTARKVGADTLLAQIIKMVQEAQGSKAPVQKLVDKIAGVFVPVVIGIALLSMIVWVIAGGENGFTQGLLALVTVLVIACPCALGLATPTAIMVGVGKGAEQGILIKDAESIELAKKINAVVLDKTGTVTEGKPQVTDIRWVNDNDEWKVIFASLEKASEHPLAEAIVQSIKVSRYLPVTQFESISGRGARAMIAGKIYFAGNEQLMKEQGISIAPALLPVADTWFQQAKTVIWFSDKKQVLAVVAIADAVKPTSAKAIQLLKDRGIEVYMLTGDNKSTAAAVAAQAGITQFKSEVLPADKADFIKTLQRQGKVVAMVGDGINDSNALAQADVGIAMGHGSDIAMDVAKMTIVSSDLTKIATAIRLSDFTVKAIRQNLFWAFIYNIIGIPLAAGILYPINGFLLNPMIAGAAMALSSVSVVGNSLRLRRKL